MHSTKSASAGCLLLLEKVAYSLFHLSIWLELATLECLFYWPSVHMLVLSCCCCHSWNIAGRCGNKWWSRAWHISFWLATLVKLSAPVIHHCFWHTSIAICGLQPPLNLHWLTVLCAQKLNNQSCIDGCGMWYAVFCRPPYVFQLNSHCNVCHKTKLCSVLQF